MAFLVVFLAVFYKTPSYLFGLVIPAGLVYLGISTTHDFDDGSIVELAVLCTGVATYKLRKTTHVTFRTDDDPPKFLSFILPGKEEKIFPNSAYIIYFNQRQPETLLGYTAI